MVENNFKFKLIHLSEKLQKYADLSEKISLSNLADAYLVISSVIYELLRKYNSKRGKLSEGYEELLVLIKLILNKSTNLSDDGDKDSRDRISIWENKSFMINNLGMYLTRMENLEQNKMSWIAIIISSSALIISFISIFF